MQRQRNVASRVCQIKTGDSARRMGRTRQRRPVERKSPTMTERKRRSRRRGTRGKDCARARTKREEIVVEIVFGDPNEPPSPDPPANTADDDSQNGSESQTNRFVFRF